MTSYPTYELVLHRTYYDKGFFNIGVEIERFVRLHSGSVEVLLGVSKSSINGRVDRTANLNGTPRIFGGAELRNWFQRNFDLNSVVNVHIIGPKKMWITGGNK